MFFLEGSNRMVGLFPRVTEAQLMMLRNQLADNATADTNGLWNGTETWTSTPGASMMLAFQGTELFLYSTLSPDGGYMSVIIDNITTPVSLNNSEVLYGSWVFSVEGLDPSWMHAVTITMLNGTNVNVDKVSIQPPTPNAFPPAWPQVELAGMFQNMSPKGFQSALNSHDYSLAKSNWHTTAIVRSCDTDTNNYTCGGNYDD